MNLELVGTILKLIGLGLIGISIYIAGYIRGMRTFQKQLKKAAEEYGISLTYEEK